MWKFKSYIYLSPTHYKKIQDSDSISLTACEAGPGSLSSFIHNASITFLNQSIILCILKKRNLEKLKRIGIGLHNC